MKQLFGLSLILLFGMHAFDAMAQTQGITPHAKHVIDSTYNAWIKSRKVAGLSLAIVDHGNVVYATGYGYADIKNKVPASSNTIYRIGSCTKSFSALSLMQLQAKGNLNVLDPITNYLPELKLNGRFNQQQPPLIRDMLTHVSGLPCDVMNGFFCDAPPDINGLIAELNKQYPIFPARFTHAYSNVAYGLLGEAIQRTGGSSYADYVDNHIFKPLKMNQSFISYDSVKAKSYAKGYYGTIEAMDPMIRDQAAGLIHSSVLDMSNYLMMYLNRGKFEGNELLNSNSILEMEKDHIADITLPSSEEWGYGLYSKKVKIKKGKDSSFVRMTGHGGDTYLYHADFKYIPELQVGVVLMTNSSNGGGLVNGMKLLKMYLDLKDSIKLSEAQVPKDSLLMQKDSICKGDEIKGVYNMGEMIMKVNNLDKITFSQGPAKVKFLRNPGDLWTYRAKAVLFYIVPIKINNQEFKFVKHDDRVYLKVRFPKSGGEEFMSFKSNDLTLNQAWLNRCGAYEVTGKLYACKDCPFLNFEGMKLNLKNENGFIKMTFQGKTPDTAGELYLDIFNDELAFGGGLGRGKGETIRILSNGHLYYSGFEFKKKGAL